MLPESTERGDTGSRSDHDDRSLRFGGQVKIRRADIQENDQRFNRSVEKQYRHDRRSNVTNTCERSTALYRRRSVEPGSWSRRRNAWDPCHLDIDLSLTCERSKDNCSSCDSSMNMVKYCTLRLEGDDGCSDIDSLGIDQRRRRDTVEPRLEEWKLRDEQSSVDGHRRKL